MDEMNEAEVESNPTEAVLLDENFIVFELDFENSLLEITLPGSIKLVIPIATALENSQYLRCFYEAASKKSSNVNKKSRLSLLELGWDTIELSHFIMFFY